MLCLTRFLNVPLNPLLLYPLLLLALSGINSTLFFSLFRWFLSSLFQDFILLEATISVLLKKVVLTNFAISWESTCVGVSFLIKLLAFRPATLLKKTSIQVFSCEYCEIFQNTYFEKHFRTAAFLLFLSV